MWSCTLEVNYTYTTRIHGRCIAGCTITLPTGGTQCVSFLYTEPLYNHEHNNNMISSFYAHGVRIYVNVHYVCGTRYTGTCIAYYTRQLSLLPTSSDEYLCITEIKNVSQDNVLHIRNIYICISNVLSQ
jgi:hypothetical protein